MTVWKNVLRSPHRPSDNDRIATHESKERRKRMNDWHSIQAYVNSHSMRCGAAVYMCVTSELMANQLKMHTEFYTKVSSCQPSPHDLESTISYFLSAQCLRMRWLQSNRACMWSKSIGTKATSLKRATLEFPDLGESIERWSAHYSVTKVHSEGWVRWAGSHYSFVFGLTQLDSAAQMLDAIRPNPSQFDATRRDSTLLNATRHTISMKLYEFERPWNVIYSFFYERVNKWGPQNRNWNVGWVYMANMCYGIFIVNESTIGGGGSGGGGGGDSISTNIIHGGTEQTTQTRIKKMPRKRTARKNPIFFAHFSDFQPFFSPLVDRFR